MFSSLICVVPYIIVHVPEKKNSQHLKDDDRVSHVGYQESTSPLPESHIALYFDLTFLSWEVYYYYTRLRGCLKSAHLTET